MKRSVEIFTVERLYKKRNQIGFPEFQRERELWPDAKKSMLIDSILKDIDIPKLYFSKTSPTTYDVIDGQQRLWAVWNFLDNKFQYEFDGSRKYFNELSTTQKRRIADYEFQVTVLENASDKYLRDLFVRLQLGLLLNPGERLNAASGQMKDFVFAKLAKQSFILKLGIPSRRFARENLCAQIAINVVSKTKSREFTRTRYEELLRFFEIYAEPKGAEAAIFSSCKEGMIRALTGLNSTFGQDAFRLTNRSFILSIYFLFTHTFDGKSVKDAERQKFVQFVLGLWQGIKDEAKLGIDRKNRELYDFQSLLSSAPGEKYQIERRDVKLRQFYSEYCKTGRLPGATKP